MKDIKTILRSLGLLESEIKIYMTGLKHGAGTVLDFSKKTRLSRQAVYTALDALIDRGLISTSLSGKKKFFASEHPDKLLAYAKRYSHELESRINDLEKLAPELALQIGGDRPIVKLFEGKAGLKAAIEYRSKTDYKNSYEITDADAMYTVLTEEDLKPLRMGMKRGGKKIKSLFSGTPSQKIVDSDRLQLPKEYSNFKTDIGIYGDKIEMYTFEGKMYSLVIENKELANTMKILFELATEALKNKQKK